jgi:hypothetical protein
MRARLADVRIHGATTRMTSVAKAGARTHALRERCELLLRANRLPELDELFSEHPELAAKDWARKVALRLDSLYYRRAKRGRPRGSFWIHPLWVVGLIQELRRCGLFKTLDEAFGELARRGFATSAYAAKQAYHSGLRDERFEAVLIRVGPEFGICAEEYKARFGDSEMLKYGQRATRTICDPVQGNVNITFVGEK